MSRRQVHHRRGTYLPGRRVQAHLLRAGRRPDPVKPIVPMQDPVLRLTQHGRSWTLAEVGAIGPDLTTAVDVTLPRAVRAGPAVLTLLDRRVNSGAQLDLVII